VHELRERIKGLEQDAARYRWLRYGDNDDEVLQFTKLNTPYLPRNEKLDAAIDAAMNPSR
jgi:hypothetical protein